MILRVARGTLLPNTEARAFEALRTAARAMTRPDGLEALYIGRKVRDRDVEFVSISVWRDVDAIVAAIGPRWQEVTVLPGLEDCVRDASIEHLETIVADFADLAALVAAG